MPKGVSSISPSTDSAQRALCKSNKMHEQARRLACDIIGNRISYCDRHVRIITTESCSVYVTEQLSASQVEGMADWGAEQSQLQTSMRLETICWRRYVRLLTRWFQLRFSFDWTPIRLQFDRATTILRYGLSVLGCCTSA